MRCECCDGVFVDEVGLMLVADATRLYVDGRAHAAERARAAELEQDALIESALERHAKLHEQLRKSRAAG